MSLDQSLVKADDIITLVNNATPDTLAHKLGRVGASDVDLKDAQDHLTDRVELLSQTVNNLTDKQVATQANVAELSELVPSKPKGPTASFCPCCHYRKSEASPDAAKCKTDKKTATRQHRCSPAKACQGPDVNPLCRLPHCKIVCGGSLLVKGVWGAVVCFSVYNLIIGTFLNSAPRHGPARN